MDNFQPNNKLHLKTLDFNNTIPITMKPHEDSTIINRKEYIISNFTNLTNQFNKQIFKKCIYTGFRRLKAVPLFTRFDAYDVLTKPNNFFSYKFNYSIKEADFFINLLIENSIITGCDLYDKSGVLFDDTININEPLSLQKARFNLMNFKECDLNLKKTKNVFILLNPPFDFKLILIAIFCILCVLVLSGYQIWPDFLKKKSYFLFQLLLAFTAFIFVLGAVRLLFFIFTYFFAYPGIWIFPRLFADIGFFESFVPLWEKAKVTDFESKK
ncbi:Translocation protein sec62 [Cucumispora dikerogammari]|nr:Translocation protein sec62 [Cucumispora dikerogammari]